MLIGNMLSDGKSHVTDIFLNLEERTVIQLDLDKEDNDPVCFWQHLSQGMSSLAEPYHNSFPYLSEYREQYFEFLKKAAKNSPFLLVINNFQVIIRDEIRRFILELIKIKPTYLYIFLLVNDHKIPNEFSCDTVERIESVPSLYKAWKN